MNNISKMSIYFKFLRYLIVRFSPFPNGIPKCRGAELMDIIGSVSYAVMQVVHFSVVCLCEGRLNRKTGLFQKKCIPPVKGNAFGKRLLPWLVRNGVSGASAGP